jgi:hypothetical protein
MLQGMGFQFFSLTTQISEPIICSSAPVYMGIRRIASFDGACGFDQTCMFCNLLIMIRENKGRHTPLVLHRKSYVGNAH